MLKIIKVLFFTLFSFSVILTAEVNPEDNFQEANKLYLAKNYSEAIELYKEILDENYESAGLYYNLGNAYYRIGQLGYSILYYEKALKLSPHDEDIKHNISLARLRTVDRIETLPEFFLFKWWEGLLSYFSLQDWTIMILLFYFILLGSAGYYFFAGNTVKQKKALVTGAVTLSFLILTGALFLVKYNREVNEIHGIIISNTSVVKLSPEDTAEDAFVIHEGLKTKIEDKVKNWLKIRLIDGKIGWIKEGEVEVI